VCYANGQVNATYRAIYASKQSGRIIKQNTSNFASLKTIKAEVNIMDNNKYPENYFEHYIVSFSGIGQTPDKAGFEKLARLYIDIEGLDAFSELIKEIQIINENNDWSYFESVIEDFEIKGLDTVKLKEMADVAIKVLKNI
jgi:ribosomal protein L19